MNSLLVLFSYHHKNTEKVANVFAQVLDAQIKNPRDINPEEIQKYDLVGFGSGIYAAKHHKSILDLVDKLPQATNKKAFIFSKCTFEKDLEKNHSTLKEKLESKGYVIADEFNCKGHNTNSFSRFFGGLNRGRPNAGDLKFRRVCSETETETTKEGKGEISLTNTETTENWFSRAKAEADKGIPINERIAGIGIFFMGSVLMVLYLAAHQMWSTGFFTETFGTLEMIMLYGSWIAWIITSGLEGVLGQRLLSRLFDTFGGIIFISVATAWLLVVFPFEFTYFADVLPAILRFLLQWISNDIARVIMVLYIIAMGIAAIYAPIGYKFIKINSSNHQ